MVKKVILGSLLSMVVVLMMGTAAFAGTPPTVPQAVSQASCAAHCAIFLGGSNQGVSTWVKGMEPGDWGAPLGPARMTDYCGDCCRAWVDKFTPSE